MSDKALEHWQRMESWVSIRDLGELKSEFANSCLQLSAATCVAVYQPNFSGRKLVPISFAGNQLSSLPPAISLEGYNSLASTLQALNLKSNYYFDAIGASTTSASSTLKQNIFGNTESAFSAIHVDDDLIFNQLFIFLLRSTQRADEQILDLNDIAPLLQTVARTFQTLSLKLAREKTEDLSNLYQETEQQAALKRKQLGANSKTLAEKLLGNSVAIQRVREKVLKYAACDFSVLITGETGTGKELVAEQLHALSTHAGEQISVFNSAALKPAFFSDKERLPNAGTLVLTNIGELEEHSQVALLDELQAIKVQDREAVFKNLRLICTSRIPTTELLERKLLREDLFHRISQLNIHLAPLRERPEDLELVTESLLQEIAAASQTEKKVISQDTLAMLMTNGLKGNLGELRNILTEICLQYPDSMEINAEHLTSSGEKFSPTRVSDTASLDLKSALKSYEEDLLRTAFESCKGDRAKMAKSLNLPLRTLSHKLRQQGISEKEAS